ncbi:hypothetical protein BELL_0038g00010 [Botrytis elliptica]|uniref:Uncharacterized protein n=1 Tax=Botrytis elliptica TaxID=278938 RepID=A0A4Z1K102_9HELO|nr:hypothetical protein BELL_0038g00010 [Botrytis elliptica]
MTWYCDGGRILQSFRDIPRSSNLRMVGKRGIILRIMVWVERKAESRVPPPQYPVQSYCTYHSKKPGDEEHRTHIDEHGGDGGDDKNSWDYILVLNGSLYYQKRRVVSK